MKRIGMGNEPTITVRCVKKDGKREEAKLTHFTLSEARETAKCVLQAGNGLYREVEIWTDDGTIETIQNPAAPSPVRTT
jgi:hypothetical protein